jgi:hypothetical protein
LRTRLRHTSTSADTDHDPPLAGGYSGPPGTTRVEGGCADTRVRCVIASMYDQLPSDADAPWLADAAFLPADIDDELASATMTSAPASVIPAYRRVARRVARHRRALLS